MRNMKFWRTALVATLVLTVMLSVTGGTIAWFTDSVESKNNIITAGNLDVELQYKKPGMADWADVTENTELFENSTVWEPGHAEVVALKIENAGSLALKYDLRVKINNETSSTNVYGEEFKLSDYLEVMNTPFQQYDNVGQILVENSLESRNWATGNGTFMKNGSFDVTLDDEKGQMNVGEGPWVMVISIHMPTSVGNEANHMTGAIAPSITFGIELEATQATVEYDSFDNQYDKDAPAWTGAADTTWYTEADAAVTEYTLATAEDLAGLAELVNGGNDFAGKTITLDTNLDLGNKPWTAIGSWDYTFNGTFDGQGHTISNLKINDDKAEGAGLFGVAQNATFKDVNVQNVDIVGYSEVGTIVGSPYEGCTISDCHVTGDIKLVAEWAYVGGIAAYGYVDIDNCSVIADGTGIIKSNTRNAVGGICAWLLENGNSITNCQVKNLDITGWANVGAIAGFIHYNNVMNNCKAENIVLTKTREGGNPSIGLAAGGWCYGEDKQTTITNNTFKDITLNAQSIPYDAANILYGSEYCGGTDVSGFVLANNVQSNITENLTVVTPVTP